MNSNVCLSISVSLSEALLMISASLYLHSFQVSENHDLIHLILEKCLDKQKLLEISISLLFGFFFSGIFLPIVVPSFIVSSFKQPFVVILCRYYSCAWREAWLDRIHSPCVRNGALFYFIPYICMCCFLTSMCSWITCIQVIKGSKMF